MYHGYQQTMICGLNVGDRNFGDLPFKTMITIVLKF